MASSTLEYDLQVDSAAAADLDANKQRVRDHDLIAVAALTDELLRTDPTREQNQFELFVRPGLSPRHLDFIDDLLADAVVEVRVKQSGMDYSAMRAMMRRPGVLTKRLQEGGGEVREYEWGQAADSHRLHDPRLDRHVHQRQLPADDDHRGEIQQGDGGAPQCRQPDGDHVRQDHRAGLRQPHHPVHVRGASASSPSLRCHRPTSSHWR